MFLRKHSLNFHFSILRQNSVDMAVVESMKCRKDSGKFESQRKTYKTFHRTNFPRWTNGALFDLFDRYGSTLTASSGLNSIQKI